MKKANLIRAIREGGRKEGGNEARDRRARISRKGTEKESEPLLLSHFRPRNVVSSSVGSVENCVQDSVHKNHFCAGDISFNCNKCDCFIILN